MVRTNQKVEMEKAETEKEEKTDKKVNGAVEERLILDWSVTDVKELISKMQAIVPRKDRVNFQKRVTRLNWDEITVGDYSPQECKAQWEKIQKTIRTFKTLSEVLLDAAAWANEPRSSRIRKESFPDYPKVPLAQFMKYKNKVYGKMKAKHPELDMVGITKKIKKRFEKLSEEDKNLINEEYKAEMEEYHQQLQIFKQNHPEYAPQAKVKGERKRRSRRSNLGPPLPKTPFDLYFQSRATDVAPETDMKELKESLKMKWSGMSDKRKAKYIEQAVADEKRYAEELDKYSIEHPDFVEKKFKPRVTRADNNLLAEAYGRPKMPAGTNGYATFCSEFHLEHANDAVHPAGNKKWMKDAARAWKALSVEEKAQYQTRIKKEWGDYRAVCEDYLQSVPEERREDEMKILKCEPPSNCTDKNKKRKRNSSVSGSRKKSPRKGGPSGRAIFMFDNEAKFEQDNPDLEPAKLIELMHKAYDKLSIDRQAVFEERAERLSLLG